MLAEFSSALKPHYTVSRFRTLLLCLLFTALACSEKPEKIIGIKIYDYDDDVNKLAERWRDIGINTVFTSETLARDRAFREVLREKEIPVYVIFPVFFNPVLLASDTTLFGITSEGTKAKDEWVEFVCPSRKNYRAEQIVFVQELVRDLNPEGISLDFIRQFVYWEKVYEGRSPETIPTACYCSHCIADFSEKFNITIADTFPSVPAKAAYIMKYHETNWNSYRTELITSMVDEISKGVKKVKPDIKINLHAVPWRRNDFNGANIKVAAQDMARLAAYTDYVSPMCYSAMLRRDPEWISSVVLDLHQQAPDMIIPSIQVYDVADSTNFSRQEFTNSIREALKEPSRGVIFWSWPLFESDTVRMEIARAAVDNLVKMGSRE